MTAERPKLLLHPIDCDACGRCVEACRRNAIKPGPNYIYVDWSRCDGCGKCADLCDREAIELRGDAAGTAGATRPLGGLELGAGAEAVPPKHRLWRPRIGLPGAGPADDTVPETAPAVYWSVPEAVVVLVVAVALQVLMQLALGSTLVRALTANGVILARGIVIALYYAAEVCMLLWLAIRRDVGFAEAFKLDARPDLLSLPIGLSMLVATWAFSRVYLLSVTALGWKPPASTSPSIMQLFGSDAVGMTLAVIVFVVVGPVVEELMLRGVVLGALERRLGRWLGITLSALMFATLHGTLWQMLPMTFLGLALGRLASGRRSLWPAVILHVAYNAVIVAPVFLVATRGT
jgi:membrane protease YdiL (CAAX protease family)/NAD-dependent dihydropyrimidine dehydrogenase PreA subunit